HRLQSIQGVSPLNLESGHASFYSSNGLFALAQPFGCFKRLKHDVEARCALGVPPRSCAPTPRWGGGRALQNFITLVKSLSGKLAAHPNSRGPRGVFRGPLFVRRN